MPKKTETTSVVEEAEEIDFMSDEFLAQITEKDVRPGLLYNSRDKREHELKKKQLEVNAINKATSKKSMLQLQDEQREEKLSQHIDSKNKGFQMLEKMGYKPGMSIGPRDDGMKEPIPIEIKRTRGGLGEKTKREEKRRRIEEKKEELSQLSDPTAYRARLREVEEEKFIFRDLMRAQSSCQTLDTNSGMVSPVEPWFWKKIEQIIPEGDKEVIDEEDNSDEEPCEPEPGEKLSTLVEYLREKYYYCIWCGTAYENKEDLQSSCPGSTRDDH